MMTLEQLDTYLRAFSSRPLTEVADRIASLSAENARLREALEPFAAYAEVLDGKPMSGHADEVHTVHVRKGSASLRVSDCERARSALRPAAKGGTT